MRGLSLLRSSIFLLLLAFVALAFDKDRFGQVPGSITRLAAVFAALMTGAFFLYPESLTVYGLAAAVIVVAAIGQRASRQTLPVAATGLVAGIGLSLLACIPHWSGTAAYVVRQLSHAAAYPPDWWKYFQRYLFGGEANFLEIIANPDSRLGELADAWFSLPVEAAVGGLGAYAVLPSASWPVAVAFMWKLLLYGFLFVLLRGVAKAVWTIWRTEPDGSAARLLAGSLAGCLVPIAILAAGHAWAAGKGLAMAAPMLFTLLVAPIAAKRGEPGAVVASAIVVVAHLILGALRPLLVMQGLGADIPGLPTAAVHVNAQKASLDWNYDRVSAEFASCNGVVIDVAHPMMNHVLRSLAADRGIAWASPNIFSWSGKTGRAYLPTGWDKFDCLVSAERLTANPGQRLISVATDRSSREYLEGRRDVLEIGTEAPPESRHVACSARIDAWWSASVGVSQRAFRCSEQAFGAGANIAPRVVAHADLGQRIHRQDQWPRDLSRKRAGGTPVVNARRVRRRGDSGRRAGDERCHPLSRRSP